MTRTVAIYSGGDWYDASCDILEIPANIDLAAERSKWRVWYNTEYCPALKLHQDAPPSSKPKHPKYISFIDWLKLIGATDSDMETFHDE